MHFQIKIQKNEIKPRKKNLKNNMHFASFSLNHRKTISVSKRMCENNWKFHMKC